MRVGLYGAYSTRDTGPSRVTEGLAGALADAGVDVDLFVHGDRQEPPREEIGLTHLGPSPDSAYSYLAVQREAHEAMADHDVTHALGGFYPPCSVNTVQWTSGEWERWRRCRRDFGGYRALAGDLLLNGARRIGATRSDVVVASSPETARQLRDHWRFEPDHVIPLGIGPTAEPDSYEPSSPPRVLIPGRITEKKGQHRVLNRLDPDPELTVDVVGSVADEEYRATIRGDWAFHGFVERSKLDWFYREADIVVVPSYHENFSMTALEAVSNGCALVITETCGFAQFEDVASCAGVEVVSDGREAAEAVHSLATDPDLADRKRAAYELSRAYRWSEIAERYRRLYERIA